MDEAIASVCAQTWRNWELLLGRRRLDGRRHRDRAPLGRAPSRPHPLLRARRPPEPGHERVAERGRRACARRLRRVPRRRRRLAAAQARDAGRHPRGASLTSSMVYGPSGVLVQAGPAVRKTSARDHYGDIGLAPDTIAEPRTLLTMALQNEGGTMPGICSLARAAQSVRADRRVRGRSSAARTRIRSSWRRCSCRRASSSPARARTAIASTRARAAPRRSRRASIIRSCRIRRDARTSSGCRGYLAHEGVDDPGAARRASRRELRAVRPRAPLRLEVARPLRRSPRAPRARARARDPAAGTGVSRAPVAAGTAASGCRRSASSGSGASGGARR